MENDRPRSVQSLSVAAKMKRGRPIRAKLTEDIIASEALALMDERGWSGLTMNALASRLHVRAPSLYHYIDGQSDLIHLIRAQIVRKIETAQLAESSWQNAILTFGMSYYRAFLQHTNAIGILSVTPIQDRETFHMYECFLGALDRGGWGADRGIEILAGLEYLALGSAYAHSASDVMLNAELAEANDAPILAKFVRARVSKGNDVEPTFTRLLEDFVAMFTIEREREGVPTPQQQ